jgi:hypothetical protein
MHFSATSFLLSFFYIQLYTLCVHMVGLIKENKLEQQSSISLISQTGLQMLTTETIAVTSAGFWKILGRISESN